MPLPVWWLVLKPWVKQLIVAVALLLVSYAITPKPKSPKPPAVGQAELPSAEEGEAIPVIFGTVRVKQSSVLATFRARAIPIRKRAG